MQRRNALACGQSAQRSWHVGCQQLILIEAVGQLSAASLSSLREQWGHLPRGQQGCPCLGHGDCSYDLGLSVWSPLGVSRGSSSSRPFFLSYFCSCDLHAFPSGYFPCCALNMRDTPR